MILEQKRSKFIDYSSKIYHTSPRRTALNVFQLLISFWYNMLIVWFGPASAHISHFCGGFSIALAFYFRRQSTSKRWKFTVALRLLGHHTLTTFSHELAQTRLDWRHAYIMTSCVRIPPPLCATLALTDVMHILWRHARASLHPSAPPCAYCDVTCRHPLVSRVGGITTRYQVQKERNGKKQWKQKWNLLKLTMYGS